MIKTLQDYKNLIQQYLDKCYEHIVNHIWVKSSKMSPVSIDIWCDESLTNRWVYDSLRNYCIMSIRCETEPIQEVVIRIYDTYMEAPNLVRYNKK